MTPTLLAADIVLVALGMVAVSFFIVFIRLVRGPSLPDRVVALDLTGTVAVGFMAIYSVVVEEPVYLDAAIALALIAFLSTIAFARYTEKGDRRE